MSEFSQVPRNEFNKVPYVRHVPTDGRTVFLLPYYDHEENDWILVAPVRASELGRIAGGEPVISPYVAKEPAELRDYPFPLGTLVVQFLSFPGVSGAWTRVVDRVFQLACILEKYEILTVRPPRSTLGRQVLLAAELEYLLVVIRSLYDLLQKFAKHSAALVVHLDGNGGRVIDDLRDRFSQMVLHGNELLSESELADRYGLPEPIAQFYAREAQHFRLIRDLRDGIVHHGKGVPTVYEIRRGAAVSVRQAPWAELPIWNEQTLHEDRLGSLRAVFYYLVNDVLAMTYRFAQAFTSCVAVPPAIAPETVVYLRHPFAHHLVAIDDVLSDPWEYAKTESNQASANGG